MDIAEIRAKAQSIVERAKDDPTFFERLQTDPKGVLTAEGLSDAEYQMLESESEVAGYICMISLFPDPPPLTMKGSGCGPTMTGF